MLLLSVACSEAEDSANALLCDGSSGARLVYSDDGGNVPTTYSFSHAYGHSFFVVDGSCRYWAGEEYLKGVRTGTLTPERASGIARDLHYSQFARLKAYTGSDCPDATTRTLSDGTNNVRCTCDCRDQTPVEYQQAFSRLDGVFRQLFDAGAPAELPIRVIATDQTHPDYTAAAWPLTWSPREVLWNGTTRPSPSAGRLVTEAMELTALRMLRQAVVDRYAHNFAVKVSDAGSEFMVFPRDEAPAGVADALARLR